MFQVLIGDSGKEWNLQENFRLNVAAVPRKNLNEPIRFEPERIPIKIKMSDIKSFRIQASFSGNDEVSRISSLFFTTPVTDEISLEMKNELVNENAWLIDTQNWKEGSIASLSFSLIEESKSSEIDVDLWVNVNGLQDTISVDIYSDIIDGKPSQKSYKNTINFYRDNGNLVPTHNGKAHFASIHERFSEMGVYRYRGNEVTIHPKQTFTTHILEKIISLSRHKSRNNLRIAYLGLDSGENFFSVNRCLDSFDDIEELCLITHPDWDYKYQQLLNSQIEKISEANYKTFVATTDDLNDHEGIEEYDVVIATYVASWADDSIKSSLEKLMGDKTILISVEPTSPEFVARSFGSLKRHNIREIFRSSMKPKLYEIDLSNQINLSSDYIQWSAWSTDKDFDFSDRVSITSSEAIGQYPNRFDIAKERRKYLETMVEESSLVKCAGYFLDCRKLYHADINLPRFEQTISELNVGSDGKTHENQYSELPNLSFGLIGGAGVGKSIRFRQLFIERLEIILDKGFKTLLPLFIESRILGEKIENHLNESDKYWYNRFHIKKSSYFEEVVKPEKFDDFSYDTVIGMLVEAAIDTTPGLSSVFNINDLTNLVKDSKIELFFDGIDEVSTKISNCIHSICKSDFYHGTVEKIKDKRLEKNLKISEILNDLLKIALDWEDCEEDESLDNDEIEVMKKLVISKIEDYGDKSLITNVKQYWQFENKLDVIIELLEDVNFQNEYLQSLIPLTRLTRSYCLSGRPSVEQNIKRIVHPVQAKLITSAYESEIIHISAMNFGENIHVKVIDGIIEALKMNKEPVKSLLIEIVNENRDAWNHPFRIGWLVYFLCSGKTKKELSSSTSTLSFEKLLIQNLVESSIRSSERFKHESNSTLFKSIYDIVLTIACFLHPTTDTGTEKSLISIKKYLENIFPAWVSKNGLGNIELGEFSDFILFEIPIYVTNESSIFWTHQRILDAAAALHLEDNISSYNDYSFFNALVPTPSLFDYKMLKSPQIIFDRVSIRHGGSNEEDTLLAILQYLCEEELTLKHLKFANIQLNSLLGKEYKKVIGIDNLNDSFLYSGGALLPPIFDKPLEEIKQRYLEIEPTKIIKEINSIYDLWSYVTAAGLVPYLKLSQKELNVIQKNSQKIIELNFGNPELALEHFTKSDKIATLLLNYIEIVPGERHMYSPFMGEIILAGFEQEHQKNVMLYSDAIESYINRVDLMQVTEMRIIHLERERLDPDDIVQTKSGLFMHAVLFQMLDGLPYSKYSRTVSNVSGNFSRLTERSRGYNVWRKNQSAIKYSSASIHEDEKNEYWLEDEKIWSSFGDNLEEDDDKN